MKFRGMGNTLKTYLSSNKLESLEEMDNTYDLPKLNQEDINHPNRSKINEIEAVKNSLSTKKILAPNKFSDEVYQSFKGKLTSMLLKQFHKIEKEGMLLNSFCEASVSLTGYQNWI
jgi:hypothetical protein